MSDLVHAWWAQAETATQRRQRRDAEIVRLYVDKRLQVPRISTMMNLHIDTVRSTLRRMGVEMRPREYTGRLKVPRCARCGIRLDTDEQTLDVAKTFDICDDCVLMIKAGEMCDYDELADEPWQAIYDAELDAEQLVAVEARRLEQLMALELGTRPRPQKGRPPLCRSRRG